MLQDSFVIIVVIVVIIIIHRLGRGSLQPQKTVSSSRHTNPPSLYSSIFHFHLKHLSTC